jgi:hypothetical protein
MKMRNDLSRIAVCRAMRDCYSIAQVAVNLDLADIIEQKRAYNANRADHKLENRLKAGGKAF